MKIMIIYIKKILTFIIKKKKKKKDQIFANGQIEIIKFY